MKTMRKLMNCFVAVALAFAPGLALAQNGGAAADLKFTGAGAYVDRSGRNATIASPTIVKNENAKTDGEYALDFSGGGTYAVTLTDSATVPSLSSSGDGWTLATWIKPTITAYGLEKNAWNYIVVTYDKGGYRAWQNGTLRSEPGCLMSNYDVIDASESDTKMNVTCGASDMAKIAGYVPFSISGMTLTLGGKLITNKYGSSATFKGYMDEVLALNRAVSQYEMVRLYHTGDPTIFTTGKGTHIAAFDQTGDTSNYQSPWSTWRAPVPGADYIIESGHTIKSTGAAGKCFAGRTLTIGRCEALLSRVDGSTVASAGKGVLALGHTGYTSFHKLVLNAGSVTGIRTGLNSDLSGDSNGTGGGVVEVNAPAADPFTLTFSADTTIGGAVTGAAGTGLKFTGGKNVTFAAGALDGYAGEFDFGSCGNVTATLACDSGAPANPLKVSALASGKTVTLNFTGTLPAVEGSYAVATLPAGANFAAGTLPTVAGGEYAAHAVADDSGSSRVIKLEVRKNPMTATVTGATGPANGTSYSCTFAITDPADGYTALWAWTDAEGFTHDAPNAYDAEGVYTNIVKVTKAGYYDFYGTGVVTVTHYEPPTVASENGTVTIIIPAGLVTASKPVYLAWDTTDQGDDFADWTNKAKIGDVTSVGDTFNVAGATHSIPNGAAIRAFVVDCATYTAVDYLQSSDGAYIDTGLKLTQADKMTCDFSFVRLRA